MKVLALDTETSGLPRFDIPAEDPSQPRICSLGYVLFDPEAEDADLACYDLVKPDGWQIPPVVTRVHGLTVERLAKEGRPIHDVLNNFMVAWELCDRITGYNLAFDLKMLRGELRRDGRPDRHADKPEICCMQASAPLCRIAPTDRMLAAGYRRSKMPKLAEAYQLLLGKPYIGAHNALTDAQAVVELYRWMHAQGKLPSASWF
jgi:DNA polymerase-3 subunit epsilon